MVDIVANPEWKSVRILERDEVALGGVGGNMNEQATALVARTELLMQEKADTSDIMQGQYSFSTLATFEAAKSTIPDNSVVIIDEVGENQGINTWDGVTLTKSTFDPLAQAKNYTDTVKLILDKDISTNKDSSTKLLVAMQELVNALDAESLDLNQKISNVLSSITIIQSGIVGVNDELSQHLTAIQVLVMALNSESYDLNTKVAAVKSDITTIFSSNSEIKDELKNHLVAIQILVKAIESQSDEIQKAKDSIKDQIVSQHIAVKNLSEIDKPYADLYLYAKSVDIQVEVPRENIASWMSNDGLKLWSFYNDKLLESADFGETWYVIYSFTTSDRVEWVRQLDNGELLMQTITFIYDGQGQLSQRLERIQRTIGYKSGTFTIAPCFSFENPWVYAAYGWSVSEYKNIVLVFEYGAKANEAFGGGYVAPVGMNARYLRLSLDYGVTWKVIFDLNDYAVTDKVHGHGVCYDPYWQRIWLTYGDGSNATMYSDDLGETWIFAHHITVYEGEHQNVGIVALPDCILFATDYHPDGVHRIDRKHGKHTVDGKYPIDSAYFINIGQTQRKYVCMSIFKSKHQPVNPVLFGFCPETGDAYSCVIGTYDGFNFFNVWTDTLLQPTGRGLQTVVGVTPINEIIVKSSDTRTSGTAKLTKITLKV